MSTPQGLFLIAMLALWLVNIRLNRSTGENLQKTRLLLDKIGTLREGKR